MYALVEVDNFPGVHVAMWNPKFWMLSEKELLEVRRQDLLFSRDLREFFQRENMQKSAADGYGSDKKFWSSVDSLLRNFAVRLGRASAVVRR